MSAPNKRRKTNDYEANASPKKVRGLDYFFGKQKKDASTAVGIIGGGKDGVKVVEDAREVEEVLSDEALARKLQAQWDAEERGQQIKSPIDGMQDQLDGGRDDGKQKQQEETHVAVAVELAADADAESSESKEQPAQAPQPPTNAFAAMGTKKKNTLSLQSATADEDAISYSIPLDESPLTFDPGKYIPDLKKQWTGESGNATYALLTHCFVLVNSTSSRIKIVDTLVNMLRLIIESDPSSLLPTVWLATNSISPPYIDLELGLGGSAISKALKKVCGLDNPGLKKLYDKYGDAGDVAFEAKKRQSLTLRKPKPLTIKSVFDSLVRIANSKGQGSVETKQRIVERLVQDARGAEESRYIVRTLVQHLRIGAVKTTMLIALSRAFLLSRPSTADFPIRDPKALARLSKQDLAEAYSRGEELVKACFARRPNYNDLVPTLLDVGIADELLLRCGLALHIPLRPMLGGITRELGEMLVKLQGRDFTCEYKYDGQRAQVHCDDAGKVTIFSRHLEVMTDKYPDLVALVPEIRGDGVRSFILEGEVVALDRETGALKPFQVLANRARKDVVIQSVTVDVCLFAFDLMYLNGEELLGRPLRERRSLLRSLFVEIPQHFTWVKSIDATSADSDTVSAFFKQAVADRCEGFMAKVLDNSPNPDLDGELHGEGASLESTPAPRSLPPTPSKKKKKSTKARTAEDDSALAEKKTSRRKALLATYEPDKRLDSWLKVKKDYDSTSFDTIDLIPIGAWHGQGRKAKWWSPILLAARNPETGQLEAVTKCMAGFTDKFYQANKAKYDDEDPENANVLRGGKPAYVEYFGRPDVWFHAQEVWEMAFADVTLSPTYTAAIGLVSEERGLSLRFPRFLKVREDKGIEEASTTGFLAGLYRKQEATGRVAVGEEEMEEVEEGE